MASTIVTRLGPGVQQLFEKLQRRGAIHCTSPGAPAALAKALGTSLANGQPLSAYAGFDPTGPSLHLGHLAVILGLRRLQDAGIRPVALIGGATALVGDPTGKSADRPLLTTDVVASNAVGIRKCLESLIDFSPGVGGAAPSASSSGGALLVNNADFYSSLNVLEFMRTVGTRFRLSAMLNKDSVKSRLEGSSSDGNDSAAAASGMSYTEFSYQLFQSYDFLQLYQRHGCVLQVGGADQWGNITAGIEYVRRASAGTVEVHGLTVPLITTATGAKFGKSEGNVVVWLDSALTSHHAFYQYLLNTHDADAPKLLRLLTLLPDDDIAGLEAAHAAAPEKKAAQIALADEVTRLVRGGEAVTSARRSAAALFGAKFTGGAETSVNGGDDAAGTALRADDILALVDAGQLPSARVTAAEAWPAEGSPWEVADAAVRCGAAKSKAEARRMIAAKGLYLNHARVENQRQALGRADFVGGQVALLASGKKKMWALQLQV